MKVTVCNQTIQIDKEDLHLLEQNKWFYNKKTGYLQTRTKDKTIYLHRLITECPDDMQVDHINLDKLDLRRKNLRLVTLHQNLLNRRVYKNSKSGIKCVRKTKSGRWYAEIGVNGRTKHLGTYDTVFGAIKAYNEASERLHGKFGNKIKMFDMLGPITEMIIQKIVG